MGIETLLYLIDIIDNFSGFLIFSALICFMTFVVCSLCLKWIEDNRSRHDDDEEKKRYDLAVSRSYLYRKLAFYIFLVSCCLNVFLPSKQTMYAMALAKYSKRCDIPAKVIKMLELKLEYIINEYKQCYDFYLGLF